MKEYKLIIFTLVAVIFTVLLNYINGMGGEINVGNGTYISTVFIYTSIGIYIYFFRQKNNSFYQDPKPIKMLFAFWIIWNIFCILRGSFLSVDYWDFKTIFFANLPFSFIGLTFFLGNDINKAKTVFLITLNYVFVYGLLIIPLSFITNRELYTRVMLPVSLFILFIPFVKNSWKILIIVTAIISILLVIDFRSNVLKIVFSFLLLFLYYFRKIIHIRWLLLLNILLFLIPITLFVLGVSGQYNIFEEMAKNDEFDTEDYEGEDENLAADTRTFLYVEVLNSVSNSGHLILGEGAGGKYLTDYFDEIGDGRGRYGCEVGVLNILLFNGIIGVVIYCLLLAFVSFIAIIKSNNILAKLIGLYIASRWLFFFIEEFTDYDINFYFFWIAVGLVSSTKFRNMNDTEIFNFLKLK